MSFKQTGARFAKATVVTALTGASCFALWTRKCRWPLIDESTDSILTSVHFLKFNPLRNPTLLDNCVQRVPLSEIPQDLVQDLEQGGTRLIERFSGSIWGSSGES